MTYKIQLTPMVITQAKEIKNYISIALSSSIAAKNWINHLKESIKKLDEMPNRFPIVDEEPWKTRKIHRMNVDNYFVYYLVDEGAKVVAIQTIIYAKRNQIDVLKRKIK